MDYPRCEPCGRTLYPQLQAALSVMLRNSGRLGGQYETRECGDGWHVHRISERRHVNA